MANAREIKLRIKGINATMKITKAMKLISAAKLKKARAMHEATMPFFIRIQNTMSDILQRLPGIESVYFDKRENKENRKKAYIVISSDKGMTGGYNHNVLKLAESIMEKENSVVFPIGRVLIEKFKNDGYNLNTNFGIDQYIVDVDTARAISSYMIKLFESGIIDELHLVYTHMESAISLKPRVIKLLPLDKSAFENVERTSEVLDFEPTPETVFNILASKYVKGILYGGMVEAFVSEHSARMNAMDNATTNAEKMINKLTLNYNRARQAAITQEISEIVGGSAALE